MNFRLPEQELTGKQRDKDCEEIRTKKKPTHNKLPNCPLRLFSPFRPRLWAEEVMCEAHDVFHWSASFMCLISVNPVFFFEEQNKTDIFCHHLSQKKDSKRNQQCCGQTGTNRLFMLVKISSILQEEDKELFFSPTTLAFG